MVDGIDFGKKFQDYQLAVSEYVQSKDVLVEKNTHEILALSHILLIKNKQESAMYKQFFSDDNVNLMAESIKSKFGIGQYRLESPTKSALEDIVYDLRQKSISTQSAVKKLTQILSDGEDNKADMLILGVRNLIESLPRTKFNALIRESNLSCSYIHCILNPIFTSPENSTHLMW